MWPHPTARPITCGIPTSGRISGSRSDCGPVAAPQAVFRGSESVTEKHCLIDHLHASRNSELTRGRTGEGDADGHIEPLGIVGRDCRASWSLRPGCLRRVKRGDYIKIRYV